MGLWLAVLEASMFVIGDESYLGEVDIERLDVSRTQEGHTVFCVARRNVRAVCQVFENSMKRKRTLQLSLKFEVMRLIELSIYP